MPPRILTRKISYEKARKIGYTREGQVKNANNNHASMHRFAPNTNIRMGIKIR
jgi:hypothetical protein